MKRIALSILMVCTLLAVSCVDYEKQIEDLQGQIDKMNSNITDLETITSSLGALRNLLVIGQAGDPIMSAKQSAKGYDFEFKTNGVVNVINQTAGISVGYEDGDFFWTLDGEPLTNASGAKAVITVAPEFRINDGKIEMSTDGKKSWIPIAASSKNLVEKVEENASYITVTFLGNTVVEFPKEKLLAVMLSGDGSTMATTGKATVEFYIDGKTDEYTVTPLLADGWSAQTAWENAVKGSVDFTAPAPSADATARLFFCDGIGHMVTTDINFADLKVDEAFPVMYPAWDAYNVPAAGGTVEVSLYTNQESYDVAIEGGEGWLERASTKAVREDKVSFTAVANTDVEMRCAKVTFTSGVYVQTVYIWQDGVSVPSGENLSASGTANCYIVSKAGEYWFDATVMGCGDSGILPSVAAPNEDFPTSSVLEAEPEKTTVVWDSGDVITDVKMTDGKISFTATGNEGNALIAVKNSRDLVIWSWHIWCTDVPAERTHTNPDMLQFTTLDRNLGATSANPEDGEATYGLYYQWGRKDPFEAATCVERMPRNSAHSVAFAIRYPERPYNQDGNTEGNWYKSLNIYLWGNPDYGKNRYLKDLKKSIYDPCPVGYMVPPANTFMIFEDESRTQFTETGLVVRGEYGQTSYYPFAGRLYEYQTTAGSELVLWHSCVARYGVNGVETAGGAQTLVSKDSRAMYWYQGDIRSRVIPVRCVKQVTE
ncbi:MAG: hypothetical protein J5801_05490 [Bacteroidales bacterium]|nr:hypothetical protein [Bacteroidales bacterium]